MIIFDNVKENPLYLVLNSNKAMRTLAGEENISNRSTKESIYQSTKGNE